MQNSRSLKEAFDLLQANAHVVKIGRQGVHITCLQLVNWTNKLAEEN